jgi:hypothetical protein
MTVAGLALQALENRASLIFCPGTPQPPGQIFKQRVERDFALALKPLQVRIFGPKSLAGLLEIGQPRGGVKRLGVSGGGKSRGRK